MKINAQGERILHGLDVELIGRGYLPSEFPPCFSSLSLWRFVSSDNSWVDDKESWKGEETHLCQHHILTSDGRKRLLSVPNPKSYTRLCKVIRIAESELMKKIYRSDISMSRPRRNANYLGRAVAYRGSFNMRRRKRLSLMSQFRFRMKLDVARFYPSVYTHSIPWVLYGKQFAKKYRYEKGPKKIALWGNCLDKAIRSCQDGQTNGMPIGPDSSIYIMELVLSEIDHSCDLAHRSMRWYDDYEIYAESRQECDTIRSQIEKSLYDLGLELNNKKMVIEELPVRIEDAWLDRIRKIKDWIDDKRNYVSQNPPVPRRRIVYQISDLLHDVLRDNEAKPVLKYALKLIEHMPKVESISGHMHDMFMYFMQLEPRITPWCIRNMVLWSEAGCPPDTEKLTRSIERLIVRYSARYVALEIAWCLWAALVFDLNLRNEIIEEVFKVNDDVCLILLLDLRRRNQVSDSLKFREVVQCYDGEWFCGEHWLFCYEMSRLGWLDKEIKATKPVPDNEDCELLKENGVWFYNDQWTVETASMVPSDSLYQLTPQDEDEKDGPADDDSSVQ